MAPRLQDGRGQGSLLGRACWGIPSPPSFWVSIDASSSASNPVRALRRPVVAVRSLRPRELRLQRRAQGEGLRRDDHRGDAPELAADAQEEARRLSGARFCCGPRCPPVGTRGPRLTATGRNSLLWPPPKRFWSARPAQRRMFIAQGVSHTPGLYSHGVCVAQRACWHTDAQLC